MRKILILCGVVIFMLTITSAAVPSEFGTTAEAEAMVKKAIAFLKANGKEKGFAEISNPKGKFIDRDLYVFVYDLNGKCVAHGFNQKMVGKDLLQLKDADDKYFVKERVEIIKTKGKGWQDYKFTNPVSRKVENKSAYVEKFEDFVVGCGVYKK